MVRSVTVLWASMGVLGSPAWAQEADSPAFDGHGPTLPPPGASDGLAVWAHAPRLAGAWSLAGVIEGVDDLLVEEAPSGDVVPVLDDVVGIDLTGSAQLLDRLGVAMTVPIWLTSNGVEGRAGPTLGDAWVWSPIDIVRRDTERNVGFGLGIRPGLGLPTGAAERLLGARGLSGSLSLDAGLGLGPVRLSLDVGGIGQGREVLAAGQTVGGWRLATDALAGVGVGPVFPAVEVRSSTPLARAVESAADRPVEVLLTVRGRLGSGAWAAAGGGRGVTRGIGAPGLRVLVGGGWVHDPAAELARTPDAVEVVKVTVTAPDGLVVPGAELRAGTRLLATTGPDGTAELRPSRATSGGVTVSAPGLGPAELTLEGATATVALPWVPRLVPVRVQDQAGKPVDAAFTVTSLDAPGLPPVRGSGAPSLPPGTWELSFTAAGSGEQRRVVVVPPRGAPSAVDVVLLPDVGTGGISLALTDPEGAPIAGARVLIDGQPVGVSGARGDVHIGGLAAGEHEIIVRSDVFAERQIQAVAVGADMVAVPLALDRVAGSVRVTVRGPDGEPATDAILRFDGPRRLAPTPVGERGERLQVLGAGEWKLLVTSTRFGVQERAISVPEDSLALIGVDVVLQAAEQGASDLLVRVVDPEGEPVDRASIAIDGVAVGQTSTGGEVVLRGLDGGPRELAIEGEMHRPVARTLALVDGYQEAVLTLDWVAGATLIYVHDPTKAIGDATARVTGPLDVPARPIGADGREMLALAPGEWTVLVTSPTAGLFDAGVDVAPDDRRLHVVDALMLPEEGGESELSLTVRDPDGALVDGARVSLDGELVGITGDAGVAIDALDAGSRMLRVEAPPLLAPLERRISLAKGANEQKVSLGWGAGTAEIQVVDTRGAPVPDAVLRLAGPSTLPPTPVDGAGERRLVLAPGAWQVLATSSTLGFAEHAFEITGKERLAPVRVVFEPSASGRSDLLVRVLDPDGVPIPDAAIAVEERSAKASKTGAAVLELDPGPTTVSVTAPGFLPTAFTLQLDGATERVAILRWEPVALDVEVVDAVGQPVDAELRLVGPEDRPVVRTGLDGAEQLALRPGTWQVIAATSTLGPTLAEVEIGRKAERMKLVLESSRVEVTDAAVRMREQVMFDFDQATLQSGSDAVLRQIANTIVSRPSIIRVEVQGHTDDKGTVSYNQELSQLRAEAVVGALVKLGVPQEKLLAVGYGMQRPLQPNDSEEHRAANRRVVFEIAEGTQRGQ